MDKIQQTNKVVIVIGVLAIIFSMYGAFAGQSFSDYFFSLVIGSALVGTALINNQEWKKQQQHEK